eukprot:CAMPEP_0115885796 /NCGR_PEP_ID=MMETSP0287-20121206/30865_1 /TAXON_ID=412157 /ORGANISM="Chrysochromulina rotalis, Strain UIO044" /LENGTH=141 /DNA_ID=CAMNT_0003342237 /DNA_START=50 /DNA_END=475 /DNA_ORIENTATION=-
MPPSKPALSVAHAAGTKDGSSPSKRGAKPSARKTAGQTSNRPGSAAKKKGSTAEESGKTITETSGLTSEAENLMAEAFGGLRQPIAEESLKPSDESPAEMAAIDKLAKAPEEVTAGSPGVPTPPPSEYKASAGGTDVVSKA